LKLIKAGMDSRQVIRRFEQERQALALMDHTNIARVLDAGTTEAGRPYFVMELVKGVPVTKYCDELHLSLRERLELFVPVCQAIQHAHQKGIIHRDVKPSNVLIAMQDGKPVAKVIDFGVAKALHQQLTEQSLYTEIGQVVGTLEYMSPEQAELSALDIDTRADVYALGVFLYELLTGTTPLPRQRLHQAGYLERLRLIREEEPPRPSTRLSESKETLASVAAMRRTEPWRLAREVRGELDWIVMKALEKDRTRRYETANDLARDIQRYLADEPVEACPPSAAYKLRKFARKHRHVLATACAFVLLLITAASVSTGQALRATQAETKARQALALAEERFDLAKDAVDKYLNEVTETPELKNANFRELRKRLLETALPFYQKLAEQAPGDPEREAARGRAYGRLGDIRFEMGEYNFKPGEAEVALADYRAMHAIFARLAEAFPDEPDYPHDLTRSLIGQGQFLRGTGRSADSEAAYRAGLAVGQQLVNDFPSIPAFRSDLARCHNRLSELLAWERAGKFAEAEAEARAALQEQQRLVDEYPNNTDYRYELAKSHNNLGSFLVCQHKGAESWAEYRVALEQQRRLADEYPNVPKYRHYLAMNLWDMGVFHPTRGEGAEAAYRAALKEQWRVVGEHPYVPEYRDYLFVYLGALVGLLAGQGKQVEAEGECREAIRLKPDAPEPHGVLAELLAKRGQWEKAEGEYREAIRLEPKNAVTWNARGDFYRQHHEYAKALADYSRAIELRPDFAEALWDRGYAYLALHEYDKVLADLNKAIELNPGPVWLLYARGRAYAGLHQYDKAFADFNKAIELDPKDAKAWASRGFVYAALTRWDKATSDFSKAVELNPDDPLARCRLALARLGAGDLPGYRSACAALLDRFGQADLPDTARWVLVLAPDAVNDRNRLVLRAEAALRKGPQTGWAAAILGAALYRADRFAEAVRRLDEANAAWEQAATKPAVYSPAYTWFFLAMAYQRQGDAAEARRWLDKAQKWMDQETQDSRNPAWNRRLTLQVLRREAEQLLAAPAREEKPRAQAPAR
jgi:tetratricopeptide (TPR) repeat protein